MRARFILFLAALLALTCGPDSSGNQTVSPSSSAGKADQFDASRSFEVILTNPHCDVCENRDKDHLLASSAIVARVIELIDGAQTSIDVAQFTFSRRNIEEALLRAHSRGVKVRLAMNAAQEQGDNPSTRLAAAGIDVHFVKGRDNGSFAGLQHAKYMLVDGKWLLMGSNNWSSTGVSINEENTIVVRSSSADPMLVAFDCYFEAMVRRDTANAVACNSDEVRFTPSSAPWGMIREEIRAAQTSIDVLMHHLVFSDAVKELAKAAERGVRVRIIVNAADRAELRGSQFERLLAAGGQVRFKRTNGDMFQLMHDKLAVIDGKVLLNGSGNWSGSAFFNNWEFYVRHDQPEVVRPFRDLFHRLWTWSLSAESLDAGLTPREQDVAATRVYFGNLHAHHESVADDGRLLDDGKLERQVEGEVVDVSPEAARGAARHAFDYARNVGKMDFMALTPHVQDDDPDDALSIPNMNAEGYAQIVDVARQATADSNGTFVALAGYEWSTNSTGNHLTVLGTTELAKVERGDFRTMYEGFLPLRDEDGERPLLMFNHPRTFRHFDALNGNWDQIFGVNLLDLPKASERNKKFNDYGLDDYPPLEDVLSSWIDGATLPDEQVVFETLANLERAQRPYGRLMEVTVGRGNEFGSDTPQNPSLSEDVDTQEIERFHKAHSDWDYYLLRGFQIAPIASHDNHWANFGTGHTSRTALYASELSELALMDAIDDRAAYASEDENLAVRFYADDLVRSGQRLTTLDDAVTLQFMLSDPDFDGPFDVVIRGGRVGAEEVVETLRFDNVAAGGWQEVEVEVANPGVHFFYLEVTETAPNRMAWSAPIWVERK